MADETQPDSSRPSGSDPVADSRQRGASHSDDGVGTFAAMRDGTFRWLWAASWAYYTGRAMELAVLSWLILELTDSPASVALVAVSRAAPMFVFGVLAGSLSDRYRRRSVMLAAQTLNLAIVLVLTVLMMTSRIETWHVYSGIAVTGFSWALDFTARRAYLASLFSGRALTNAMSLDTGALISSNLTGPLFGTSLLRWTDFGGAYVGITAFTVSGLVLLFTLRGEVPPVGAAPAPLRVLAEALGIARRHRSVMATLLVTMVFNLFGWPISTQIPVIARDELGVPEILYGVLAGGLGVGALVGAVILATLNPRRRGSVYSLGTLLFLVAAFGFALSPWYLLSLALLIVAGMGLVSFGIMQPLLVIEVVPPELRGRALGAVALAIGASPMGMLLVGFIAETAGPRMGVAVPTVIGLALMLVLRRRYSVLRGSPELAEAPTPNNTSA